MLRSTTSIAARYAVRSERGCTSRACVQNQTNCLYPCENSCTNCEGWTKTAVRHNENSESGTFELTDAPVRPHLERHQPVIHRRTGERSFRLADLKILRLARNL